MMITFKAIILLLKVEKNNKNMITPISINTIKSFKKFKNETKNDKKSTSLIRLAIPLKAIVIAYAAKITYTTCVASLFLVKYAKNKIPSTDAAIIICVNDSNILDILSVRHTFIPHNHNSTIMILYTGFGFNLYDYN